jgi:WXXGXW repeat (2 copies)
MVDGTVVTDDPPAPIAEYIPVSPDPAFVWIGGYWGWRGGWFWNAGHYARPPFRGAAWISGGWAHGGRGWAWHGGRWR